MGSQVLTNIGTKRRLWLKEKFVLRGGGQPPVLRCTVPAKRSARLIGSTSIDMLTGKRCTCQHLDSASLSKSPLCVEISTLTSHLTHIIIDV